MSDRPTRAALAYHEAGHAVVSLAVGHDVMSVTITSTGDYFGQVTGDQWPEEVAPGLPDPFGANDAFLRGQVAILIAGPMAELRFSGDLHEGTETGDFLQAWTLVSWAPSCTDEESVRRFYEACEARARELLDAHWPAVARVAEALLERGTLSGEEVREAFSRGDESRRAGLDGAGELDG